jgi:uncharacterized cofD-like protein
MKNIVTIGGGNGQPVVLRALKEIEKINIKAIVTTMDDGGSTGVLREELNILPPGDVMKCALALSSCENKLSNFLLKRFSDDNKLKGHTTGNMLLSMMVKYLGSYDKAIDSLGKHLNSKGKVIPVTNEKTSLVAEYDNGQIIEGEHKIDENYYEDEKVKIKNLKINPEVRANEKALEAILGADYIFLGPGDLYTSVIANFTILEIKEAILNTKAKIYYFMNLMTKKGQTHNLGTKEIVLELEKYLGRRVDGVIVNDEHIPKKFILKYEKAGENPIKDNLKNDERVFKVSLVYKNFIFMDKNDSLSRSILKHDKDKIKKIILKIIE